jgi:hypothetical protein
VVCIQTYRTIFATLPHLLQTEVVVCIYICYIATFATDRGRGMHIYICYIATFATDRGRGMHSTTTNFYLPTYKQLQKILTSLIFKSVEVLAS